MSQLKNVGPEEFESPEAYVAFGRLCRELEVFAGQLNPDYIQGPHGYALEDGSHGCATSEDIGGRLLTEVIFEAHRFRGHGYDEKTGIAFPAAPAGAEYRLLSSIRYIVDGLLDFPDDVRPVYVISDCLARSEFAEHVTLPLRPQANVLAVEIAICAHRTPDALVATLS